ncbi:MAG: hypothetical protein K6U08_00710 [Firmicutes bacterium]|nr:hypothetical protein [Bacillota bacterium]
MVRLTDQSRVEETVEHLRRLLPGYSVVSVARDAAFANARGFPERVYMCPPALRSPVLPPEQPAVPAGGRNLMGAVLFVFAGLVTAAGELIALPIALFNGLSLRDFAQGLLRHLGTVALLTVGSSLVFAVVPMVRTLRISVAEAFRTDE